MFTTGPDATILSIQSYLVVISVPSTQFQILPRDLYFGQQGLAFI